MFCPNCGNEIQDGAKFCAKCGNQIENAGASVMQPEKPNVAANKADNKGIILIVTVAVCVLLVLTLVIFKLATGRGRANDRTDGYEQSTNDDSVKVKGGYGSYEDVIDTYYKAAFDKDVKGVVACYPEKMQSAMQNLYNKYRGGEYYGDQAVFRFTTEADGNEYSYVIGERTELSADEQSELEAKYGVSFDEVYTVETSLSCKYLQEIMGMSGYVTDTTSAPLKVARIGKKWFLVEGTAEWMWQQQ